MIGLISEYVTSRAKEFYVDHVAGRVDEWTFETLFRAMFDECFPRNIYREFQQKWYRMN